MDIMYECMIVCMCVPEFMGRLNQGPNPQGNLQICYAGVCARNCALANPKVHQNPSCHTSKLPQQQRGVCQKLRFSKPQSAPKPILPHQQTPTAAAGCEQNHSCLRAEGISWPGLDYPSLGRSAALGAESFLPRGGIIPASGRKGLRPQAGARAARARPLPRACAPCH